VGGENELLTGALDGGAGGGFIDDDVPCRLVTRNAVVLGSETPVGNTGTGS